MKYQYTLENQAAIVTHLTIRDLETIISVLKPTMDEDWLQMELHDETVEVIKQATSALKLHFRLKADKWEDRTSTDDE